MDSRLQIDRSTQNVTLSPLESSYPHIVEGLLKVWNSAETTEHYLDSLLVDDRNDRKGLPESVFEELMFLSDLNWKRTHFNDEGVQITADNFSFGGL
jgi:hypothetical protein